MGIGFELEYAAVLKGKGDKMQNMCRLANKPEMDSKYFKISCKAGRDVKESDMYKTRSSASKLIV